MTADVSSFLLYVLTFNLSNQCGVIYRRSPKTSRRSFTWRKTRFPVPPRRHKGSDRAKSCEDRDECSSRDDPTRQWLFQRQLVYQHLDRQEKIWTGKTWKKWLKKFQIYPTSCSPRQEKNWSGMNSIQPNCTRKPLVDIPEIVFSKNVAKEKKLLDIAAPRLKAWSKVSMTSLITSVIWCLLCCRRRLNSDEC